MSSQARKLTWRANQRSSYQKERKTATKIFGEGLTIGVGRIHMQEEYDEALEGDLT